ncbi:hypothetical protein AB0I68_35040 [Streptomyces sp. NPDC050448]|uniref:hypothetical protein n=1 Tax=Streptomyces sp. NPDC050448 TaxID=3155404 RepID=UPI00342A96A9
MVDLNDPGRDLTRFLLPEVGRLVETGEPQEPYRLLDRAGLPVVPVTSFFAELQAASRPVTTVRSYGMDLLRWYRFLWAVDVAWDRATRSEARDFSRWLQLADKPVRIHWRHQRQGTTIPRPSGAKRAEPGAPNPVTGKPTPGRKYAPTTRAHSETVLRSFYEFHLEEGTGPIINPFPLDRFRRGRANAHHNPMEPFRHEGKGRYRPRVSKQLPRHIPDEMFNALFAALKYNRDRALLSALMPIPNFPQSYSSPQLVHGVNQLGNVGSGEPA